jgi:hypothetical protein
MSASRDQTILGRNNWKDDHPLFGINRADRQQHVYVIGRTGTGKTTLLTTMIMQDIKLGEGLCVIDPHGDLAARLLDFVPSRRINDVVYFNGADHTHPIAFNALETVPPDHPHFATEKSLVASGLVSVFKKLWPDFWGPRLEYILRNAILALLDSPGTTLLALPRFLTDDHYRAQVLRRVRDPVVRAFWEEEYPQYTKSLRAEALSPIQNKVGQFLSSPVLRNIIAQRHSTIDPGAIMDQGKICIISLSKGLMGEDNAALLGAMLITKFQLAAMARARVPEDERGDFYLYVDEFQSFATDSFSGILSEARKYGLNLTLAHQYVGQLPDSLRDAIFGNVGTVVAFRVGARDGLWLEPEFFPQIKQPDLIDFPNYRAAVKMTVDGVPQLPFSMSTIVPKSPELHEHHQETIIQQSRQRYGRPRERVERRLERWLTKSPARSPSVERRTLTRSTP